MPVLDAVYFAEPVELCQINYGQYNKKKYRYFYGMSWGDLDKVNFFQPNLPNLYAV